jgi:hypothetical protein
VVTSTTAAQQLALHELQTKEAACNSFVLSCLGNGLCLFYVLCRKIITCKCHVATEASLLSNSPTFGALSKEFMESKPDLGLLRSVRTKNMYVSNTPLNDEQTLGGGSSFLSDKQTIRSMLSQRIFPAYASLPSFSSPMVWEVMMNALNCRASRPSFVIDT